MLWCFRRMPGMPCVILGQSRFLLGQSFYNIFSKSLSTEVNTKVSKDVLLFKYDNPTLFRVLNMFSVCQFTLWSYLSYNFATSLRNVPVPADSSLPWWRKINFGDPKYKYGLTLGCLIIAGGVLASSTGYIMRSVRYLILHKGGQRLTVVTYMPFGKNRVITVDMNKVSCLQSRHSSRVQIPLKISGHRFHFILDTRGEFTNGKLFDYTAGLKRNLQY